MKKGVVIFYILFMLSFVCADVVGDNIPIQIQTVDNSGNIITGTFEFKIDISTSSSCTPVLYSNTSTRTTDARGIVSYNLENVNLNFSEQYWFCYYRDGVLKDTVKAARVPYTFRAKNVTLSGVEVNTNFNLGGYNITASVGNFGVQISNYALNVMGNANITGNLTLGGKINGVTLPPPACAGTEKLSFDGTTFSCQPDQLGSSGSGIIASGSNANGAYVQFADGTMICTTPPSMQMTINTLSTNTYGSTAGNVYYGTGTWTYPIPFIYPPSVSVPAATDITTPAVGVSATVAHPVTASNVTFLILSSLNSNTYNISAMAVGRWTTLTNITQNTTSWAVNGNGDTVLFDISRKVGIGTTNPTSKLHVLGDVNITGNLYVNGTIVGSGVPTGAIMAFNSASCPTGWILADGTSGTPDLRGIFLRGSGTNSILKYANGSYFGIGYGTYGNDSFQGHKHRFTDSIGYGVTGGGGTPVAGAFQSAGDTYHTGSPTTDTTNGTPRTGAETTPAYYATIYCVKTGSDSGTSTTIWGTSGNTVLLNNQSNNLSLQNTSTIYYAPNASELSMGTLHYIYQHNDSWDISLGSADSWATYHCMRCPIGSKGVRMKVYADRPFHFRQGGASWTGDINTITFGIVGGPYSWGFVDISLNSSRDFEWQRYSAGAGTLYAAEKGYWI